MKYSKIIINKIISKINNKINNIINSKINKIFNKKINFKKKNKFLVDYIFNFKLNKLVLLNIFFNNFSFSFFKSKIY